MTYWLICAISEGGTAYFPETTKITPQFLVSFVLFSCSINSFLVSVFLKTLCLSFCPFLTFYFLFGEIRFRLKMKVKETTDTASFASFLDLYLEFNDSGQLSTKIYDKRDDFNFKIINFPNMCSNIPPSPAYGVYISQLIRYARASSNYSDFLKRHLHLRNRLMDQG